ncbi:TetR/AcrR family transcriptional regulator [Amycolatopsis sp. SID8362]|uniref:TetR/AcrR family transcriptional regulator n=1 Tax=Amycolatopsis sp. SID8362 TaxID=2690346 RepID=UPI00136ACCAB|nr:TetR/AcrR family transcriptional regulator [Amycolatopsis sp. SID8362]NBH05633.1 TetR family transcriptional regulator [Amycolatopsis sp. SID8362]NED42332.1 TetR/AcrR family transcriptional regulator [Amycolatopsis sp. SID8362]
MTDVKSPGKRRYDSSGRQAKARERRIEVVEAARALFERDGFRATTITAIAAAAGVSTVQVYKAFGSKAELAKAVFDIALAGDHEPVAVADRPASTRVHEEPDVRRKIALFVDGLCERLARSAKVQILIRDGRHVDETLEPVWVALNQEGLAGMTQLGQHLLDTGQLRPGIDIAEVRDVLWNYLAIDNYERLVLHRGWTLPRYRDWLTRTIADALL